MPSSARSTTARSRMSPTCSSTSGSRYSGRGAPSCTCSMRLSRTRTWSPARSSSSARWEPMNPAPPVISTRRTGSSESGAPPSAGDELVEAALGALVRFLLIEEREVVLVEGLEELVPGDLVQAFVLVAEVDPQDARVAVSARVGDRGRTPSSLLDPAADFVVVRGRLRLGHVPPLSACRVRFPHNPQEKLLNPRISRSPRMAVEGARRFPGA